MAITFNQGPRLIYKPKDLGIDLAYNDLLAWLNRRGAPVALRPLLVLARDGYGWVEFAAPEACRDEDAVERYYRRVGALVCLVYLLQGSDCHAENLIASGEQPILVDCETLLNPWPHAAEARGGRRASITQRLIRDSVLSSALLPGLAADGHDGAGTPCGVCDGRREARERRGRWVGINTDRMTMRPVFDWPWTLKNLPHIGGAPAHAEDHLDAISAGFVATYRFLIAQQPALLDPTGPLAAFRGQFVRFVFRATRRYGAILVFALRPSHLRDGADFSLAFELLARALLTAGDRPASWPILGAERGALTQLDIPFLGAYTDRDALELDGGGRVSGYFVRPSYDAMQEKARNLGEADLAFQLGLLRSAIREDIVRRQPAPPPAALHGRAELT